MDRDLFALGLVTSQASPRGLIHSQPHSTVGPDRRSATQSQPRAALQRLRAVMRTQADHLKAAGIPVHGLPQAVQDRLENPVAEQAENGDHRNISRHGKRRRVNIDDFPGAATAPAPKALEIHGGKIAQGGVPLDADDAPERMGGGHRKDPSCARSVLQKDVFGADPQSAKRRVDPRVARLLSSRETRCSASRLNGCRRNSERPFPVSLVRAGESGSQSRPRTLAAQLARQTVNEGVFHVRTLGEQPCGELRDSRPDSLASFGAAPSGPARGVAAETCRRSPRPDDGRSRRSLSVRYRRSLRDDLAKYVPGSRCTLPTQPRQQTNSDRPSTVTFSGSP